MAVSFTDPNFKNRKTPGVYITEFNAFPQAVVGVQTAVPAFIGYTQQAILFGKSALFQPIAISSMADYEQIFGKECDPLYDIIALPATPPPSPAPPPPPVDFTVPSDTGMQSYAVAPSGTRPPFSLYYNMQMFFANGGSNCYVVSVGDYSSQEIDVKDLQAGLTAISNQVGPTMLVIPEAVYLPPDLPVSTPVPTSQDFIALTLSMIEQARTLQDRVAILDVYGSLSVTQTTVDTALEACIEQFQAPLTSLPAPSYGMAYFPFLNTSIIEPTDINYTNFAPDQLVVLTTVPEATADSLGRTAQAAVTATATAVASTKAAASASAAAAAAAAATPSVLPTATQLTALIGLVDQAAADAASAATVAGAAKTAADTASTTATAAAAANTASTALAADAATLKPLAADADQTSTDAATTSTDAGTAKTAADALTASSVTSALLTALSNDCAKAAQDAVTASGDAVKAATATTTACFTMLQQLLTQFNNAQYPPNTATAANTKVLSYINQIFQTDPHDSPTVIALNNILMNALAQYKLLLSIVARKAGVLPPSATMAGIFTLNDQNRGVWNAPANMTLASTVSPTINLNSDQQSGLNVPLNGLAVDVIRNFVGRGPVVWGARTLDGNSLDWRYIQVRRTIIYVEQSIKTAINQFVFAPNVSSTWVAVIQMVSGFLQGLWSQGGLMGDKASSAFTVQCGVPSTMTATDILNGYMVVQVTLQMVHPAEFIELTFMQTMQGS